MKRQTRPNKASPLRAHFDGSYSEEYDLMTYSVCIYDQQNNLILRRLGSEQKGSALESEIRAALLAITSVKELGINEKTKWLLIGDHRGLINLLHNPKQKLKKEQEQLKPLIEECRQLLGAGQPKWIKREFNFVADWTSKQKQLAKPGYFIDLPLNSLCPKARQKEEEIRNQWPNQAQKFIVTKKTQNRSRQKTKHTNNHY